MREQILGRECAGNLAQSILRLAKLFGDELARIVQDQQALRTIQRRQRPGERVHMTPARHEHILADCRTMGHALDDRGLELGEPEPLESGHPRRRRPISAGRHPGATAAQIDLVAHHDTRRCRGGTLPERPLRTAVGAAVIHDHEHQVRFVDGTHRPIDSDPLDRIGRLPKPRGIVNVERNAGNHDALAQQIAGRARNVGHDRRVGARKPVEQTRFADVRRTRDHQLDTVAQHRAAMGVGEGRPDLAAQCREARCRLGRLAEIELLVRKVDRRLDERTQLDERVPVALDGSRELARKRSTRAPHRRHGCAVDEVGDRLGLRQVDAIVEKGAQRELARPGRTCPELADAIEHHARDDDPTVTVKLEDVFAGERPGGLEPQRKAVVDRRSGSIHEPSVGGEAWSRRPVEVEQAMRDLDDQGTRDAHDGDTATSGGGRNRGDGVAGTGVADHRSIGSGSHPRSVSRRRRSSS